MFQYANRPQSIGKVLDNGIQLCLYSFKQVVVIAFVAAILAALPNMFGPARTDGQFATAEEAKRFFTIALITMVAGMVFYNAIVFRMHAVATNKAEALGTSLMIGLKKLFPVLLGMILYMILVMIGSVLLLVPGIILMMSLFLFSALIVLDDQGVVESLKTSHKLVWGNWWRTVTVVMVPAILIMVIYSALGFIFGVASAAAGTGHEATGMPIALLVIGVLVNTIGMPLFYSILLVLLHDLQLRKQGLDLGQRISAG